jgi:hypothetical protein
VVVGRRSSDRVRVTAVGVSASGAHSTGFDVGQARVSAGLRRALRNAAPSPPKRAIITAQFAGSGTAYRAAGDCGRQGQAAGQDCGERQGAAEN